MNYVTCHCYFYNPLTQIVRANFILVFMSTVKIMLHLAEFVGKERKLDTQKFLSETFFFTA